MSLRSSMEVAADCFDVYVLQQSSVFELRHIRGSSSVQVVVFADFSFFLVSDERDWRKLSSVGRLSNATSLSVSVAPPTQGGTARP